MSKRYRLAFLTPEFVSADGSGGGLASYLNRMTRALVEAGHEVEVFVLSERGPGVIDHEGVRVNLVGRRAEKGWLKWGQMFARWPVVRMWRAPLEILAGAQQMAEAFEKRDAELRFDLVQSSDYLAPGHYVKRREGRLHVVRSSLARELVGRVDKGDSARTRKWWTRYELEQMRRAEIAYAPSEFVAAYYREQLGREVAVVRPPAEVYDFADEGEILTGLTGKYLLHFGQLRACKGTMWLLDGLEEAWKVEPELRLAMVGPVRDSGLRRRLEGMRGEKRLVVMGEMGRRELYGVIQRAMATVLPSLADNLPNTVIESLALGVPVIGGRGASVDELVEEGRTGTLVKLEDVRGLALAMVRGWRGELTKGFVWDSAVRKMMEPRRAVAALGELVGMDLAEVEAGVRA